MKKKIVLRSMLGFPLGLALGYLITILISLIYADGVLFSMHAGISCYNGK